MQEKQNYVKLYNNILENSKLNLVDKIIFSIVTSYDEREKPCWVSNKILASKLNVCEKTIQTSINKLIKLKYINKAYIQIKTKKYRLLSVYNYSKIKDTNKLFDDILKYDWLNED